MGAEKLLQYWESREGAIEREQDDPYRYGTELPHWKVADEQLADHSELLILGGNRSGKSEYCAKASGADLSQKSRCSNLVFHDFIAKQHSFPTGSYLQISAQRV